MTNKKEIALIQIFFIFIAPIALLVTGIVPLAWRMLMLCISLLLIVGIIRFEKISDTELGIRKFSYGAVFWYLLFTCIGIAGLWYLHDIGDLQREQEWWKVQHLLFAFIPVSLLQEIAYRSFLFPKLRQLFSQTFFVIVANAFLFGILHSMYPSPLLMVGVSMIGGVGFALLYNRYPNLFLISVSHIILNFVAIYLGFFSFVS
jgi:membrane protease YdiL (CAAX protease family)